MKSNDTVLRSICVCVDRTYDCFEVICSIELTKHRLNSYRLEEKELDTFARSELSIRTRACT